MAREIYYDINQFKWVKSENAFFANAIDLYDIIDDYYHTPFPNGKSEFFIQNFDTGGFRRFRFVKEVSENHTLTDNDIEQFTITWFLFKSEDGIECYINVTP